VIIFDFNPLDQTCSCFDVIDAFTGRALPGFIRHSANVRKVITSHESYRAEVPLVQIKQLLHIGEKIGFFTLWQRYRWNIYFFKMLMVDPLSREKLKEVGVFFKHITFYVFVI
jgi:predicted nucleic acid-binding Zn ribbon protein